MTIVSRILALSGERGEQRDVVGDALSRLRPGAGYSGELKAPVPEPSIGEAIRLDTVWACVDLTADLLGTLPVGEYRRGDGVRVELQPSQIVAAPSATIGQIDWRTQYWTSQMLRGNVFALITEWTKDVWPARAEMINPDAVSWDTESGRYRVGDSLHDAYPLGDLWHVPGLTIPGYRFGLSPLMAAAAQVSLGLSVQGFGRRWFEDGAHPSAIIKSSSMISPEQANSIKTKVLQVLNGTREPLVVGKDIDYQPIQIAPEESQFLETIGASERQICRIFRMPPEMIGATSGGDSVTYANVEQRGLHFLTYSAGPRLYRAEAAWSALLPRPRYVKHKVDALQRVDYASRIKGMDIEIRNGTLGRDEARALSERPPIGGNDQFMWPPVGASLAPSTSSEDQ